VNLKIKRIPAILLDAKGASCKVPSYLIKFMPKKSKKNIPTAFEEILFNDRGGMDGVSRKRSKKTIQNGR